MFGWLKNLIPGLGGAGKALQAKSQAAASNRGTKYEGQLDFARLMAERDAENARLKAAADNDYVSNTIARETEGRAGRQDAWRKLLSAQNVLSPAAMPNVSPYAAAQRKPTDMEQQGAGALSAEVLARLQGGNPMEAIQRRDPGLEYDPTAQVDLRLLDPSKGELRAGWLGALLGGGYDAYAAQQNRRAGG